MIAWQTINNVAIGICATGFVIAFIGIVLGFIGVVVKHYQTIC